MDKKFFNPQDSVAPTIFIGLGGVGSRIVDRIAARAVLLPNWKTQLESLHAFMSIDTNSLDQNELKLIPKGNRINTADFDKQQALKNFRQSATKQVTQWVDNAYMPRAGKKPGAGQIRMESRLGFFFSSPKIKQRLQELVRYSLAPNNPWRKSTQQVYNVYIYCSLAGGTGSGSFLSAIYLVNQIIRDHQWEPRIIGNFLLSTLLWNKVGPELHKDINANTYAALKELEHLTKLDYKKVQDQGRTSEEFYYLRTDNSDLPAYVSSRPAFLSFLLDNPTHISLPNAEHAIADAAYLQVFTPIINEMAGEYDNYEKNLADLAHLPGEYKTLGLGYTKNYGCFGAAVMIIPGLDLVEYCALRFACEAIRTQITFGLDPWTQSNQDDQQNDLKIALAQHQVNYSDPKFKQMSDQDKEDLLNKAFIGSVHTMAHQEELGEIPNGYWTHLVNSVEKGLVTGYDQEGKALHGDSLLIQVRSTLERACQNLFNQIEVKNRAFNFQRDSYSQFSEIVQRLETDCREARVKVDGAMPQLLNSVRNGEAILALKLDPIAERYLVVRLLETIQKEWLPKMNNSVRVGDDKQIQSLQVQKRLKETIPKELESASQVRKKLIGIPFGNDEELFLSARNSAKRAYDEIITATRSWLEDNVRINQMRGLLQYIVDRSRMFTSIATQMDQMVQELWNEAEQFRKGERAITPAMALRIEVFETLEEPRVRIWREVFDELFTKGAAYFTTFDRQALRKCILNVLKPEVGEDGRIRPKTNNKMITEMRTELLKLGKSRVWGSIMGNEEQPGLNLESGLNLEAKIVLGARLRPGEEITQQNIANYQQKKFKALELMADVFADIDVAEAEALDDGTVVNQTRLLLIGNSDQQRANINSTFNDQMLDVLGASRSIKMPSAVWHDQHIAIVHDVKLPIPLYYFRSVVGELERSYIQIASDEERSYPLHTDFNWEESLPNLNPRGSEVTVTWALEMFVKGVFGRTITFEQINNQWSWRWHVKKDHHQLLGPILSTALYRLGEIHRNADLRKILSLQLKTILTDMDAVQLADRKKTIIDYFKGLFEDINLLDLNGEMTREEALDKPVLRALIDYLERWQIGIEAVGTDNQRKPRRTLN